MATPGAAARKSTRASKTPEHLEPTFTSKLYAQAAKEGLSYTNMEAKVFAIIMLQNKEQATSQVIHHGDQYLITYSLKNGLQKFGDKGKVQPWMMLENGKYDRLRA